MLSESISFGLMRSPEQLQSTEPGLVALCPFRHTSHTGKSQESAPIAASDTGTDSQFFQAVGMSGKRGRLIKYFYRYLRFNVKTHQEALASAVQGEPSQAAWPRHSVRVAARLRGSLPP